MKISSLFDSGSINIIRAESPDDIQLEIRSDSNAEFRQWFHFSIQGVKGYACNIRILNAGGCSYPKGWEDYNVCASYDRESWFRIPSSYDGKILSLSFISENDVVYLSYFAPYSHERHLDLLAKSQLSSLVKHDNLGYTLDGREMSLLVVGTQEEEKKRIWIIARQHPGETMAEWFVEGLLERLLDEEDSIAVDLLGKSAMYIVPNMNPDGSARGNLRANAVGTNLNREWSAPSLERSPEVYLVREKMEEIGVDLCLDVHGDEVLPYNFVAGCEGIPSFSPKVKELGSEFKKAYLAASPDFQTKFGYPKKEPGSANLSTATNYIAEAFRCLAFTIEMPFKDNCNKPNASLGWSPGRCKNFGKDCLVAIRNITHKL